MSDAENRLVTNLEARARRAKDAGDRAEALCLIIIHYARQGHVDVARADLSMLRGDPRYKESLRARVWMELVEGVIANAECDYGSALHLVQTAYNTAIQNDLHAVRPTCAAWLADIAFQMSQVQIMASRLCEVFENAAPEDHHSRARAAQTMAISMFYAADRETAKPWFEISHSHAAADGDQAALSSLFYNTAAYQLLRLRLNAAFGKLAETELDRLIYEESTFRFYDLAVRNAIQKESAALTRAQIRSLQGKCNEALNILEAIDSKRLRFSEMPIFLCEVAWAKSQLGAINEASAVAKKAHKIVGNLDDQDDLAYVKARLAEIFRANSENSLSLVLSSEAHEHLTRLHENFSYWRSQLRGVEQILRQEKTRPKPGSSVEKP